jgi:hypothetical protein
MFLHVLTFLNALKIHAHPCADIYEYTKDICILKIDAPPCAAIHEYLLFRKCLAPVPAQ